MKIYRGTRTEQGARVIVEDDGKTRAVDPRHDLRRHSPSGFEWGFAGSGPAQLALALAADVLGDDRRAQSVYQTLKFRVVGRLESDTWTLTEGELASAIALIEQNKGYFR